MSHNISRILLLTSATMLVGIIIKYYFESKKLIKSEEAITKMCLKCDEANKKLLCEMEQKFNKNIERYYDCVKVQQISGRIKIKIRFGGEERGICFVINTSNTKLYLNYDWITYCTTGGPYEKWSECNLLVGEPTIENVSRIMEIYYTEGQGQNKGYNDAPSLGEIFYSKFNIPQSAKHADDHPLENYLGGTSRFIKTKSARTVK